MADLAIRQSAENPRQLTASGQLQTLEEAALRELEDQARKYRNLVERHHSKPFDEQLLPIGQALFQWLDANTGWTASLMNGGPGLLDWDLQAARDGDPTAARLLDAPWELLAAPEGGFLARRPDSDFGVVRRLPWKGRLKDPSDYRLSLLFMAAAPLDQPELDYRAEEVAIEQAAGHAGIDLAVEESGNLEQLGTTLAQTRAALGRVDVLHLSCHGSGGGEPHLAFEREPTGATETVSPRQLWGQIGGQDIQLGFVSACHSGQGEHRDGNDPAASFAARLLQHGLPAALAWGGPVGDDEAILFAQLFYRQLSLGKPLVEAYRLAWAELANPSDQRRDWHLPRLLLADDPCRQLCRGTGRSRRTVNPQFFAESAFLGGNRLVPVARFDEFIGRRRTLQQAIAALRQPGRGLLLVGAGNLGKSSLAARLLRRFPDHVHLVIHGEELSAELLQARLQEIYPHGPKGQLAENIGPGLSPVIRAGLSRLLDQVEHPSDPGKPLMLVLDDFEIHLQDPPPGSNDLHRVKDAMRPLMADILTAFAGHGGASRLLITSRYLFSLADQGRDRAEVLAPVYLTPFGENDRQRQALRLRQAHDWTPDATAAALEKRAVQLAGGNPGVQRRLLDFLRTAPDRAQELLDEVDAFLAGGERVADAELGDYLEGLAIGRMLDTLDADELWLLQASLDLELPLPLAAWEPLLVRRGIKPESAQGHLERLLSFGLWNLHADRVDPQRPACAVDPLVAPRLQPLGEADSAYVAGRLLPELRRLWPPGEAPAACDSLLLRLAALADEPETASERAESGLGYLLHQDFYVVGYPLAAWVIPRIETPGVNLLRIGAELARSQGEMDQAAEWRSAALGLATEPQSVEEADVYGALLREEAAALRQAGELDRCEARLTEAVVAQSKFGLHREVAIARGEIADILQARGELDEALRIRTEEQLPVLERLGDKRELLVCRTNAAIYLLQRNQDGDREQAADLLQQALLAAIEMRLPEANQILQIMDDAGLLPEEIKQALDEQST